MSAFYLRVSIVQSTTRAFDETHFNNSRILRKRSSFWAMRSMSSYVTHRDCENKTTREQCHLAETFSLHLELSYDERRCVLTREWSFSKITASNRSSWATLTHTHTHTHTHICETTNDETANDEHTEGTRERNEITSKDQAYCFHSFISATRISFSRLDDESDVAVRGDLDERGWNA